MATTPTWQAATSGQLPLAAQVNQFLGPHQMQLLYPSLRKSSQTTAGSGNVTTNGTWLAQSFTTATGQTTIGYTQLNIVTTGGMAGVLTPTTVSIYTNNAGAPGTALVSTTVSAEYVTQAPATVTFPTPVTGLTQSTTYWIVVSAAGDSTHNFQWNKSNQTSGASTSANGTTWAAQTYGFIYQVWDQTISGNTPLLTWEDGGARWVWFSYSANNEINTVAEFTAGQTTMGYTQSFRVPAYTGGQLTGVT